MIEILDTRVINKGVLHAVVTIKIKNWLGFIIKDMTVWKKENGTRWVNFPARAYEKDGVKKHIPLNDFEDPSTKKEFDKKFFEAYDAYLKNLPEKTSTPRAVTEFYNEELPF